MRMLSILILCGALQAQIPATDARNTEIPNTDTHFTARTYKTLAEWQARRAYLRKQILSAAGLLPMPPKTPLHPQIFGRIENKTYSIEKVLLETMPGYYLGGNLYRPLKPAPAGGFPAIVSPHGHWNYGRLEHTVLASVPARCINFAQQGYVVVLLRHGGLQRHDTDAARFRQSGGATLGLRTAQPAVVELDPRGGLSAIAA